LATAKVDRTWHRGLTRELIIAEALRILDDAGRDALTMRRLATALEVEAPSLYAHVRSKDELVDAVLDAVLDTVEVPEPTADIRSSLVAGFANYRRALLGHPSVVVLMTERARFSGSQSRLVRRSIELLESAGLSTREAVDAHVTMIAFVLGFILQEVSRPTRPPADVAGDPVMARAFATVAGRSVDERFEVGLGLILDGAGVAPTKA
jgi:TetR/AcrR family tetracycline transcriptional repressor